MSKKVDWSQTYTPKVGNITRGNSRNTSGSMKESFKKSYEQLHEQQKAEEMLKKAFPIMKNILLQRMMEKRTLTVMRPLPYTTEVLGGEEDDDGFYNNVSKSENANAAFKSVTKMLQPGTELTFVQLEKSMNQLWFRTQDGQEVGIYLEEQNRLLTQTDIYEVVAKHLNEE